MILHWCHTAAGRRPMRAAQQQPKQCGQFGQGYESAYKCENRGRGGAACLSGTARRAIQASDHEHESGQASQAGHCRRRGGASGAVGGRCRRGGNALRGGSRAGSIHGAWGGVRTGGGGGNGGGDGGGGRAGSRRGCSNGDQRAFNVHLQSGSRAWAQCASVGSPVGSLLQDAEPCPLTLELRCVGMDSALGAAPASPAGGGPGGPGST